MTKRVLTSTATAVFLLALACRSTPAAPDPVGACTTNANHERWQTKNRSASTAGPEALTVADILAIPVPFVRGWQKVASLELPLEQRVVRVRGVVRLAKLSADDCDIHAELAMTGGASDPRIIVEMPLTQPAARSQFERLTGRATTVSARHYDGAQAISIAVTGYLFVDLSHQTAHPTRNGYAHGSNDVATLIEVHPVWLVTK